MRKIVHHEIGEPARVLRLEEGEAPPLAPDQVRIRVSYAPIHPGDLLGIMGSPAFGSPPVIGRDGRVPGFEGAGVVTKLGDEVVVSASSVVPLPVTIPDEVGAQMLINTISALTVIRAAHDALPLDMRE